MSQRDVQSTQYEIWRVIQRNTVPEDNKSVDTEIDKARSFILEKLHRTTSYSEKHISDYRVKYRSSSKLCSLMKARTLSHR